MCNGNQENPQPQTDTDDVRPNESVVVVTVDWLPSYGRDWLRYPDANVVAVSSRLDAAGRERALAEAGVR